MGKEEFILNKRAIRNVYNKSDCKAQKVFERIFGSEMFKPINRIINSFEDVVEFLGDSGLQCVNDYKVLSSMNDVSPALMAYTKLRMIATAFNDGDEFNPADYKFGLKHTSIGYHILDEESYKRFYRKEFCLPIKDTKNYIYIGCFPVYTTSYNCNGSAIIFKNPTTAESCIRKFMPLFYEYFTSDMFSHMNDCKINNGMITSKLQLPQL